MRLELIQKISVRLGVDFAAQNLFRALDGQFGDFGTQGFACALRFLGGVLLAPEAREIIAETLRREPLAVLRDALRDTARQLVTVGIGDTLPRGTVGDGLALRIASGFPPAELRRFEDSAQMRGLLPERAAPFLILQAPALILAALALPILL